MQSRKKILVLQNVGLLRIFLMIERGERYRRLVDLRYLGKKNSKTHLA